MVRCHSLSLALAEAAERAFPLRHCLKGFAQVLIDLVLGRIGACYIFGMERSRGFQPGGTRVGTGLNVSRPSPEDREHHAKNTS